VRSEIHARSAQAPGSAGEHQLRAYGVGRGGEHSTLIEREEAGEAAEPTRPGRLDRGAQALDDRLG
jgi:hypothetical protein